MSNIVDSFTQSNKGYKIYELYIDKITPDSIISILFAGKDRGLTEDENVFYHQQSNIVVISNGIKVKVYSGLERYFIDEKDTINDKKHHYSDKMSNGIGWTIIDTKQYGIRVKNKDKYVDYPFFPLPIEFSAPVMTPAGAGLQSVLVTNKEKK